MYTLTAILTKNKHLKREIAAIKLEHVQVLQVGDTKSQMTGKDVRVRSPRFHLGT